MPAATPPTCEGAAPWPLAGVAKVRCGQEPWRQRSPLHQDFLRAPRGWKLSPTYRPIVTWPSNIRCAHLPVVPLQRKPPALAGTRTRSAIVPSAVTSDTIVGSPDPIPARPSGQSLPFRARGSRLPSILSRGTSSETTPAASGVGFRPWVFRRAGPAQRCAGQARICHPRPPPRSTRPRWIILIPPLLASNSRPSPRWTVNRGFEVCWEYSEPRTRSGGAWGRALR